MFVSKTQSLQKAAAISNGMKIRIRNELQKITSQKLSNVSRSFEERLQHCTAVERSHYIKSTVHRLIKNIVKKSVEIKQDYYT